MMSLPWVHKRKVRAAANVVAAKERELALLRMQREAVQKSLNDLLKLEVKGAPKHARDG